MMRQRPCKLSRNRIWFYRLFLTSLLLAAVVSMGLSTMVSAWQTIGTPDNCSIQLQLRYTDSKTNKKVKLTGGEVTVYKVSDAIEDDGNQFFDPKTTGQFQALANRTTVDGKKIAAIRTIDSTELTKQNAALAKILAADLSGIKGASARISKGSVTVGGLTPGLYLMVMSKTSPENAKFAPFLFSLPDPQGKYEITASPKPSVVKKKGKDKPSDTTVSYGDILPQTGQLWWPVPVLLTAGLLLILFGCICRRKAGE